jgi:PAS domain S-box-containing protein
MIATLARDHFRLLVDEAAVGIASVSIDRRWLHVNGALCSIVGYTAEELIGTPVEKITFAEDIERDAWESERLLRGDIASYAVQKRYLRKDGSLAWVRICVSLMRSAAGKPEYFAKVISDVSALVRAQQQLREARDGFRELVQKTPFGLYAVDADFRLALISSGAQKVFETVQPAIGRDFAEILHLLWPEPFASQAIERFRHTLSTGESYRSSNTVEHRADIDSVESYDWQLERARLPDGRLGVVCYFYDLSQRQQLEMTLRASEERFRTLADNMSQLAWMADAKGWIFWYNRRWFDYTGTTLEQMQGWGWKQVHHPDHVERVAREIQATWDSGDPWEDTFPLRSKEGGYRWFLSRAVPIRDANGAVQRWFGTNTDVTDQMNLEHELQEANRRKDEFLAMLGHELRNPLAAITNSLHLLRGATIEPTVVEASSGIIGRQLNHLTALVDDLLDISRINQGKIELRRECVSIREILDRVIELHLPLIEAESQALTIDAHAAEALWVEADINRLVQAVGNILHNAAKYTQQRGQITIAAGDDGPRVFICVRDTGTGIEANLLPRIFDLFTQGTATRARALGGLGLGLALARQLVELHGGQITAHSNGLGSGSCFTVRLPRSEPRATTTRTDSLGLQKQVRILIVDDNLDAAESLRLLMEMHGQIAVSCYDGATALLRAAEFVPDVCILDIGLPGMSGHELARRLRQIPEARSAVLIALTGYGQSQDAQASKVSGFDHYLIKPVDLAILLPLLTVPKKASAVPPNG